MKVRIFHLAVTAVTLVRGVVKKRIPRFGEFCYCCCSPLLPQRACNILATWEWLMTLLAIPVHQNTYCRDCFFSFVPTHIKSTPWYETSDNISLVFSMHNDVHLSNVEHIIDFRNYTLGKMLKFTCLANCDTRTPSNMDVGGQKQLLNLPVPSVTRFKTG